MQTVESTAKTMLLPNQRNSGVVLSTSVKLEVIGCRGMSVGGQASISCGVLKAFDTRNSSGNSISTQNTTRTMSISRLSALNGRRGARAAVRAIGSSSASEGTALIWHLAHAAARTARG